MKLPAALLLPAIAWAGVACGDRSDQNQADSIPSDLSPVVLNDSLAQDSDSVAIAPFPTMPAEDEKTRYSGLTDRDFEIVAKELDVEVAAIKAVVLIEAGAQMKGFYAPGVPVVNFDKAMYNAHCRRAPSTAGDKNAKVPPGLSGYALKEWTQLTNHRRINAQGADMGTFWGMFQIGGFNYKLCGCSSVAQFVEEMSDSEFSQLELFARFLINTGMVNDLRRLNWSGFARKYNGASYARRGYHTKMAAAYKKFKK